MLHNEEFRDLYTSASRVSTLKSKKLREGTESNEHTYPTMK